MVVCNANLLIYNINKLVQNIQDICISINDVSQETLKNSNAITIGTGEQQTAVLELKQNISLLSTQLKDSGNTSIEIAKETVSAVDELNETKQKIKMLTESMEEITNTSNEIEKIMDNNSSIAQPTKRKRNEM